MTECINATVSRYIATATRLCAYKSIDWKINYIRKYLKENKKKAFDKQETCAFDKTNKYFHYKSLDNIISSRRVNSAELLSNHCPIVRQTYTNVI